MSVRYRSALCAHGTSLVEILVTLLIVAGFAGLLLFMLEGSRHHHGPAYGRIKDATQLRGIQQAMILWAQNNRDRYPLPSELDAADLTINADPETKNTTGNILSVLVYAGFIPTEMLVSPLEVHPRIENHAAYEFYRPSLAADPAHALWDPTFHGTPVPGFNTFSTPDSPADVGNNSYAHALPFADRRDAVWKLTYDANQAILANRGPEITRLREFANGERKAVTRPDSNTLLIHASKTKWEGNVAYNDGHVDFETRMNPDNLTYKTADGTQHTDFLFYDEPDDPTGLNSLLVVIGRSAPERDALRYWWD